MAIPVLAGAAAAAPAAKVGGGTILSTLLQGLLSGAAEGAIQSATAPGALTPSPAQGGSGSKFMITLQDVKEIQRYVNEENYRRGIFRPDLPLLNAEEIIAEREAELRRSAAEAGAREYAIKQLDVEAATRPAVAGALGTATVGAQQALADAIESIAGRPKYESSSVLTEIGRAI